MKWIRNYEIFKESKSYSNKNLVKEICTSMVLLNNTFLDDLLDKGIKARYSSNSDVFLTDLKNLLITKNRLELGKYIDGKCQKDDEISKVIEHFEGVKFDIEKDWKLLVDSRTTARSIIDKLLAEEKLEESRIKKVYWLGPNKTDEYGEDIVVELNDGRQFSFFLDKSLSKTKTASFNKLSEELIGNDLDNLFKGDYLEKWSMLTQEWITLIYENVNKNIQSHIEKFIDTKNIDKIGYFDFFSIRHNDSRYRHLGEYMKEFDRNILNLSDLLIEVWKDKKMFFKDEELVTKKWNETKVVLLNSKILEKLFTDSFKENYLDDIDKLDNNFKLATGELKMKLFKIIVEKLGCEERNIYYLDKGKSFEMIPSRQFFRRYFDDLDIMFDYHVDFTTDSEDGNNFGIVIRVEMDTDKLLDLDIDIKFAGGEMSGKLNAKYSFDISKNFNYLVSKKQTFKEQ